LQNYAKQKHEESETLKQIVDSSTKELESDRIKVGYLEVSDQTYDTLTPA
jgi:hypothetical protein